MYNKNSSHFKLTALAVVLLILPFTGADAQITWPEGQLLPSFPAPAATQDHIYLRDISGEELYLFSSLKGLVNRTQPRIFAYSGDGAAEGSHAWLTSLGYAYNNTTPWSVLSKYRQEVRGLIVYDPAQLHTVNLAIPMANDSDAIIADPSLLDRLTAAPYNFPVLADLRELNLKSTVEVYRYVYENYWLPAPEKRLLIGLSPVNHKADLREYAVAIGATVIWLDPKVTAESNLLNQFLELMPQGSNYLGWWPEEAPGVERTSYYGITTMPCDFCANLTFHSGTSRLIDPPPMPPKPELQNKIYVAFIFSDGDNLQYDEHRVRALWNNPDRGSVPMGWTLSPALVDAMPGALNYYHRSSTPNDNLLSGPSGYGYTYPNYWLRRQSHVDTTALAAFAAKTEEYNVKAGFRIITVWNTITNGLDKAAGEIYADNAPTLLGVTEQNTGSPLVIYNSTLPGRPLSCNYCGDEQGVMSHINSAAAGWNGNEPRFLIIQLNSGANVSPTTFKNVAASLDEEDYIVVRPDHIFQLIREANGLPVNPGAIEGDGEGLTGRYYNGQNFNTKIAERIDETIDFDWDNDSPIEGVDADDFTVRWKGEIQPPFTGNYTFYATCDGVRLWVNDEPVIDDWMTGRNPNTYTGKIYSLTAGEKYPITLEYLERTGVARCKLEWASAFLSRETVPQSQLYPDTAIETAIKKPILPLPLKAFPATAERGRITVQWGTGNETVSLTVYDVSGKKLLQQTGRAAGQQLDLSRYSKGIYLISAQTKNGSETIRYILH